MIDAKRLLDQFLSQSAGSGDRSSNERGDLPGFGDVGHNLRGAGVGGIGCGALAGGLAGVLMGTKRGRKLAGSALTIGGLAIVGALAYKAYRNWQEGRVPTQTHATAQNAQLLPLPAGTPFHPSSETDQQHVARNLLRAMIAAAKADGHIDAREQKKIFAKMDEFELAGDDKAFVMDELRAPLDVESVASAARTPEEAAEIYAASLLAIDIKTAAEMDYLAELATLLKLEKRLVEHLHATISTTNEYVDANEGKDQ